jgi:peroxiredoxin
MIRQIFCTILILAAFLQGHAQSAPEGLFIDSKAPDFKMKDANGNDTRLKDLLKKGKVIIIFYRGNWSPTCMAELSHIQDSLSMITDKNVAVVAISPESKENIAKTIADTHATFPIFSDDGLKIMKAYDVAFEIPENTVTRYRNSNIDIEKINGANGKWLPVPAVYIIDKESTVRYRFFEPDYKRRPSVADLLSNL